MGIVPAFDKLEDCHTCLDLGFEAAAVEQFTFERGEETLAHGVIEAIAHRAHRGPHAGVAAALAEGDRSVLATLWSTSLGRRCQRARLSACSTSSVRRWVSIAQPTILRLKVSSPTAR
jgi:hypothetical protein